MIEIGDVKEQDLMGRYQARGIWGHSLKFHISSRDCNEHHRNTQ